MEGTKSEKCYALFPYFHSLMPHIAVVDAVPRFFLFVGLCPFLGCPPSFCSLCLPSLGYLPLHWDLGVASDNVYTTMHIAMRLVSNTALPFSIVSRHVFPQPPVSISPLPPAFVLHFCAISLTPSTLFLPFFSLLLPYSLVHVKHWR